MDKYHELFFGGRCQGWELEELIVKAIKSDTRSQHQVFWKEGGHDDKEDIRVKTNGSEHKLQIKSGKIGINKEKEKTLVLSGYRLGRFGGNLNEITFYLNNHTANLISIECEIKENEKGRQFIYQIYYVDIKHLKLKNDDWQTKGKQYIQINEHGVCFSLRPSLSWQIWWAIPVKLLEAGKKHEIG